MVTTLVRAKQSGNKIARPLKVLIPLIRSDLEQGDRAGMHHYANAGAKLLEAKSQLTHGSWGQWLVKNFHLGRETARSYMRLAELRQQDHENTNGVGKMPGTIRELTGATERDRKNRAAAQPFQKALNNVNSDRYAAEMVKRDEEVTLHRKLAAELVNLGYKALAMRLHPDRGGSKDAMVRLNRVRDELQAIAETRRFV